MSVPSSGDDEPPVETSAPTAHLGGDVGSMASLLHEVAATGASAPLTPGTVIDGQYRVDKAVGAGGMGVVYLARDLRLERAVAIKLGAARSSSALARIQGEAAALAQLSHPNVVVVHQVGQHAGRIYIAMEYVGGGTARSWVSERPRTWREIVALYAAAGDGLAAAHEAGLVHRDVKPDNVVVGDDGRPRVADFGLARAIAAADGDADEGAASGEVASTRTGAVVGTLGYMPPEQLAGEAVDARADQFAFAVSLYEALFGQPPFVGTTYAELVQHVVAGVPLEIPRATPVPAAIQRAILRGLARQPADRFASMDELLAALATPAAATRRRWPWLIAVGCVAVVAVLVAWILRSRDEAAAARREAARARAEVVALKTGMRDARADARLHFDQAQAAYVGHHYPDAAREFLAAYALTPMPEMLYNAAAAWQMRAKAEGDRAAAIAAVDLYRRYLQAAPAAADRDRVESSIAALEAMATDAAAARP